MIRSIRPRSYKKYLALPIFGPIIDDFAEWSHQRGYTRGSIRNQLAETRQLVDFLQKKGLQAVDQLTHGDFDAAWFHFHHNRPAIAGTVRNIQKFLDQTHGLPAVPPAPKTRTLNELELFACYLKEIRGLVDTTIRAHLSYLERFLGAIDFEENKQALPGLNLKQVYDFIYSCSRDLNRHSLQHVVGYLRTFLRYEYSRNVLQEPFHEMIETPRVFRLEKLPRSLPWTVVNALLNSIDRTELQGLRNYAMLLLIATYGLRSSEIVSLTLDNIHWSTRTIDIPQRKTNNQLVLPLTDAVAEALINYLETSRQHLTYRQIFLRLRAPFGVLKPTAVTEAFQRQVRISGLDIPCQGPHCLRHSYAVHLLRQGTSVKVIGDILGHRNLESTCVYLRLAIEDLRSVALEVPECHAVNISLDSAAVENLPPMRSCKRIKKTMTLQSFLAEEITAYLRFHRSLGKLYVSEERTLYSLDAFLANQYPCTQELDGRIFSQWCDTSVHLMPTVRRQRMRIIRNFCLYRRRRHQHCFVPDILTFPVNHQRHIPYILSSAEVARLLCAAQQLPSVPNSPLRAQVIRLAVLLLYTSGLRRGELLRLILGDYDPSEATLFIHSTKFHKERLIPLSVTVDTELRAYLKQRQRRGLPMKESSPIIWNSIGAPEGRAYTGTGLRDNWRFLCASLKILNRKGIPPRIHDLRHSFAVNALLRWYNNGENLMVKLPHLATYMGHVNVVSTQYYLPLVESLRSSASARFEQKYGCLLTE
jgi:site-specific recombinase XerD